MEHRRCEKKLEKTDIAEVEDETTAIAEIEV
jgi:hypothetical protein